MKLAKEKNILEKVISDIKLVQTSIQSNKELSLFLQSPLIKLDKKSKAISSIYQNKVDDLTLKFIIQIAIQGRENQLLDICKKFIDLYNEANNIAEVNVTTASTLDADMRNRILSTIKEKYNYSHLELNEKVDEDIIGGMILRIGDKQVDGSIRRQINDIRKELLHD